jgi:hypothetical protein
VGVGPAVPGAYLGAAVTELDLIHDATTAPTSTEHVSEHLTV